MARGARRVVVGRGTARTAVEARRDERGIAATGKAGAGLWTGMDRLAVEARQDKEGLGMDG
jgi:hypothetical protein